MQRARVAPSNGSWSTSIPWRHGGRLTKPTDEEKGQWYFQRYIKHLPTTGEIVLFDRSWYNRAGVGMVMGFCTRQYGGSCVQARNSSGCWCATASSCSVLVLGLRKGAVDPVHHPSDRPRAAVETVADGPGVAGPLGRLLPTAKAAMIENTDTEWAPWTVVQQRQEARPGGGDAVGVGQPGLPGKDPAVVGTPTRSSSGHRKSCTRRRNYRPGSARTQRRAPRLMTTFSNVYP